MPNTPKPFIAKQANNNNNNNIPYYTKKRQERGSVRAGVLPVGPQQQKLLDYLAANGLSAAGLADQVGLQAPLLIDWLRSNQPLPLHLLAAIGPLLDLDIQQSAGEGGETSQKPLPTPTTTIDAVAADGRQANSKAKAATTVKASAVSATKTTTQVRPRIHYLVLLSSASTPVTTVPDNTLATTASAATTTNTAATPKGPTPPKPVSAGQIDMIRALLLKKKTESEVHLITRLCEGKPLEELTHAQARRVIWELTQETSGNFAVHRQHQHQQRTTNQKKKQSQTQKRPLNNHLVEQPSKIR